MCFKTYPFLTNIYLYLFHPIVYFIFLYMYLSFIRNHTNRIVIKIDNYETVCRTAYCPSTLIVHRRRTISVATATLIVHQTRWTVSVDHVDIKKKYRRLLSTDIHTCTYVDRKTDRHIIYIDT